MALLLSYNMSINLLTSGSVKWGSVTNCSFRLSFVHSLASCTASSSSTEKTCPITSPAFTLRHFLLPDERLILGLRPSRIPSITCKPIRSRAHRCPVPYTICPEPASHPFQVTPTIIFSPFIRVTHSVAIIFTLHRCFLSISPLVEKERRIKPAPSLICTTFSLGLISKPFARKKSLPSIQSYCSFSPSKI